MSEISLQLGNSYIFEVVVYDPTTQLEIAADAPPTLKISNEVGTVVFGPTASTLVIGTTGTYRVTVSLSALWLEGEFLAEWAWQISGNPFAPRFTFHGHLVTV